MLEILHALSLSLSLSLSVQVSGYCDDTVVFYVWPFHTGNTFWHGKAGGSVNGSDVIWHGILGFEHTNTCYD